MRTRRVRWHVYLARCADGSLYCGVTTNPARRIATHNAGKGAKYTRARLPVALVWSRRCASKTKAFQMEYATKRLSRLEKLRLVRGRVGPKPRPRL